MKRRHFTAMLLTLALCLSLAACGGGNQSGGPSQPANSDSGAANSGDDTVYTFIVQNQDPQGSTIGQFLEAWGAEVTEASNGRIQFEFYHGGTLGSAAESLDMVLNGTADICWSAVNSNSGRFPQFESLGLPMMGINSAMMGGRVIWEMYDRYEYMQKDFSDYKLLMLATDTQNVIGLNKNATSYADYAGLQIRASGSVTSAFFSAIGAAPISMKNPEVYEAAEKGVIDGYCSPLSAVQTFKLYEVSDYILDYPVSFGGNFMVMNKDSYNKLPDDLKEILDAHCGKYSSEMCAKAWQAGGDTARTNAEAAGTTFIPMPDELKAQWEKDAEAVWADWIAKMDSNGYDGQKIFDDLNAVIAEVADEYTQYAG